jgi:hypothetical protein
MIVLAAAYHRTEDVRIGAVVVPELKLRDVQRQIFCTDFVSVIRDSLIQCHH